MRRRFAYLALGSNVSDPSALPSRQQFHDARSQDLSNPVISALHQRRPLPYNNPHNAATLLAADCSWLSLPRLKHLECSFRAIPRWQRLPSCRSCAPLCLDPPLPCLTGPQARPRWRAAVHTALRWKKGGAVLLRARFSTNTSRSRRWCGDTRHPGRSTTPSTPIRRPA